MHNLRLLTGGQARPCLATYTYRKQSYQAAASAVRWRLGELRQRQSAVWPGRKGILAPWQPAPNQLQQYHFYRPRFIHTSGFSSTGARLQPPAEGPVLAGAVPELQLAPMVGPMAGDPSQRVARTVGGLCTLNWPGRRRNLSN